jgi:hypothetical protein
MDWYILPFLEALRIWYCTPWVSLQISFGMKVVDLGFVWLIIKWESLPQHLHETEDAVIPAVSSPGAILIPWNKWSYGIYNNIY